MISAHNTVSDEKFLNMMMERYEEDIFRKIPEQDIYRLYMDVKYGEHVRPTGSVSKIIKGFVKNLIKSREKAA